MTIVTTTYRSRRPPPKRKPRTLDLPAIVTAKRRSTGLEVPDMTPEEHQRRGDAAEALFREITRAPDDQG